METTERTVRSADGTDLHVRDRGEPGAPALVLLHGIGQSGLSWRSLVASDLAADHRLVALDLRGHGRSATPAEEAGLTGDAGWADDVRAVVDALGLDRPVLVGWSYGGIVALDHLARHGADGVAGLVLVAAPPGAGFREAAPWFDRGFLALAEGLTSPDAAAYVAAQRALVERCVDRPLPAEESAELLGEAVLTAPSTIASVLGRTVDHRPVLERSTLPLLVVTGRADRVITAAAGEAVREARPDAELRVLDTGHTPFREDPAGFADAIGPFLRALR